MEDEKQVIGRILKEEPDLLLVGSRKLGARTQ